MDCQNSTNNLLFLVNFPRNPFNPDQWLISASDWILRGLEMLKHREGFGRAKLNIITMNFSFFFLSVSHSAPDNVV